MADEIKHIIKAIDSNATSLGDNPALPPEDDMKSLSRLVLKYYEGLESKIHLLWPDMEGGFKEEDLSRLLSQAMREESKSHVALEELVARFIQEEFGLTDTDIKFDINLVDKIDTTSYRMYPEQNVDYTFEDIDDMKGLTDEIYKRRFLNVLISGAAMDYAKHIGRYIPDIEKINSDLPALYEKMMLLNEVFLFTNKAVGPSEDDGSDGGKVDVEMSSPEEPVKIQAEGLVTPILLYETVKGLLELSVAHGLPQDRAKAVYIMSKADFKFAEIWDQRLGVVLWDEIKTAIEGLDNMDVNKLGVCHIFMELSQLDCGSFNSLISNVLAKTKSGKQMLAELCDKIIHLKEQEDFDSHIADMEGQVPPQDDGYFGDDNADDILLSDSLR